jgi:Flp pilus assembly protein TadD
MGENLAIFVRFYREPGKAASDALDKGSFAFALTLMVLVMMLWVFGIGGPMRLAGAPIASVALSFLSASTFFGLAAIFLVLVPVSIAVNAAWDSLGSIGVVLRREYLSVVVPALLAWAAAYFPFALLQIAAPLFLFPLLAHMAFLVLYTVCLRTALGSTTGHAVVSVAVGWLVAIAAFVAFPLVGNLSYFLFSPWVLYMLYRSFSPDVRSLADAVNSRRNFRNQLEAAMLNPHDADAYYQLGLIYQQRRQYDEAAASFRRAIEIYPQEADAHLQLGRVLRARGALTEALGHFETALKLDRDVARQEGWRDLGGALVDLGRPQDAIEPLERYTNHRSYDPEGLYYYGMALQGVGRKEEARQVFEQTLAAVQTAPKYRRGQVRKWEGLAKSEIRKL